LTEDDEAQETDGIPDSDDSGTAGNSCTRTGWFIWSGNARSQSGGQTQRGRFPEDFIFQLAAGEFSALKDAGTVSSDGRVPLRSQLVILEQGRHAKYPPYAFTEHGAIMAAMVLNIRVHPWFSSLSRRSECPAPREGRKSN
jgi:hypothetical protein